MVSEHVRLIFMAALSFMSLLFIPRNHAHAREQTHMARAFDVAPGLLLRGFIYGAIFLYSLYMGGGVDSKYLY